MARSKSKRGTCRLCLQDEELTFEHVPPSCTWNNTKVITKDLLKDYIGKGAKWEEPTFKGPQEQRGLGQQVLCRRCNNFLNEQYVHAYRAFVYEAAKSPLEKRRVLIDLDPLRIVKQVVGMFVTINPHPGPRWDEVRAFVLDPQSTAFPRDEYRLYMFRCEGPAGKLFGFQGIMGPQKVQHLSEVCYRPIGWHLLRGDPHGQRDGFIEITSWTEHPPLAAGDRRSRIALNFGPIHGLFSPMPGDYRWPAEIRSTRRTNLGKRHGR